MKKAFVLRPGALGDVLTVQAPVSFLKQKFGFDTVNLAAPGSRGRLLYSFGSADGILDTDSVSGAWFFGDGGDEPPIRVVELAGGADLAIAYVRDDDGAVRNNLRRLGCRDVRISAPRPDENGNMHIYDYLISTIDCSACGGKLDLSLPVPFSDVLAVVNRLGLSFGNYVVLHPGSGSPRKNWPLSYYTELAGYVSGNAQVVVTSGEADGELGAELAAKADVVAYVQSPELDQLAALLAGARGYVGNDSGVSHLAGMVCTETDKGFYSPRSIAVFWVTKPEVWKPYRALAVTPDQAGKVVVTDVYAALFGA